MSVVVRGMKMPKNCCECSVNMEVCKRGYKYLLEHMELYDKRAEDCPIIELPAKHGRLIDADVLKDVLEILIDKGGDIRHWELMRWILNDAPTIIEAEVQDG